MDAQLCKTCKYSISLTTNHPFKQSSVKPSLRIAMPLKGCPWLLYDFPLKFPTPPIKEDVSSSVLEGLDANISFIPCSQIVCCNCVL